MTLPPLMIYLLGAMAACAAFLILVRINGSDVRRGPGSAAIALLALALPSLLVQFGTPATQSSPAEAARMQPETAALASSSGTPTQDDWNQIADSTLGGTAAGMPHAAADSGTATVRAQRSAAEMAVVTQREPDNVQAWLAMAQAHRLAREYPTAIAAYESALKLDANNADAWADYADALASANNRHLAGAPAAAIARALKLNPAHLKGLWLQASLDLEQRHYADALAHWKKLRAALPPGSPDIAVIDSNIAEAAQLLAQPAGRS